MTTSMALQELRRQADSHITHCIKQDNYSRLNFQEWLAENLGAARLASLIDGEVDRKAFFEVYLNDKYK